MKVTRAIASVLTLLLVATGCSTTTPPATSQLSVVVAFYPLQYVAEKVGGDHVTVSTLTQPGAEPHDLELTARQVASLSNASLVFYQKGFQAAVDTAVEQQKPTSLLDATSLVPLKAGDPHTWLDPATMITYANAVSTSLGAISPEFAADFTANAAALVADLTALDKEYSTGLATCERKVFVTSHDAFGYLAEKYKLEQVGITGLSPDAEPTPARLAEVQKVAKASGVTTIFSETLASPALAEALAKDLGLKTDVLDPLEGITPESRGTDYPSVMRSNLTALKDANGCR